mgnify:CR=1 FL=1
MNELCAAVRRRGHDARYDPTTYCWLVDEAGALAGVMTERALARRYIRESREPSELDAATTVGAAGAARRLTTKARQRRAESRFIW